jgi:hypothetical protein
MANSGTADSWPVYGWFYNPGLQPGMTLGKRVHVILRNGRHSISNSPQGWLADSANWRLTGGPFDILQWSPAE